MLKEIKNTKASLWISASAGTGKTKNLIDRILALLLNGTEPSHILCVTYTKAAAQEMLDRLSEYLSRVHKMSDLEAIHELENIGFSKNYLGKIRELYCKSQTDKWVNIQTIHSFALNILRKFPLETGIYPGIKLCDDEQKRNLLEDSFNFVLGQQKFHDSLRIISNYTSSITDLIKDNIIIKLVKFFEKNSEISDIKNLFIDLFGIDGDWLNDRHEDVLEKIREKALGESYRELFSSLIKELSEGSSTDQKKAECLQKALDFCSDDFVYATFTRDFEESKTLCTKKVSNEKLITKLFDLQKKTSDYLEIKRKFLSAKTNIAFFSVIKAIVRRFFELKSEQHLIDYDDIILQTLNLLENNASWVFYKIDQNIEHVLVDEAQDTSLEQWQVINKIAAEFFATSKSEKTIFIVGDEKQSIYSFQGANVELFKSTQQSLRKIPEYCGQDFYDIELKKSYRSEGIILSFIDQIFSEDFPKMKHKTTKNPNAGVIEVIDLFEKKEGIEKNLLGKYIADFIEKSIQNRVAVKNNSRAAEPRDFLILFRHRDINQMNCICEELQKRNIPASGTDRILLKDEIVVEDLIALAEFSIFPYDDLNCACVLKSPTIGMTEEDLMQVCLNRKGETLWHYLQNNSRIKSKYPINFLEQCCNLKMSCADFFSYVLSGDLREKFINRLGIKCLNIIDEFLNVCSNYEKEYSPNLSSFLKWFRQCKQTVKKEFYGFGNEVKIMTVHASKGLQAPFVILADAHFEPRDSPGILSNQNEKLSWNLSCDSCSESKEETLTLFWNFDSKLAPKFIKNILKKNEEDRYRESRRLLYVALTRAESYLCILGEKGQREINKNCWYSDIRNHTKSFFRDGLSLRYGEYPTFSAGKTTSEKVFVKSDQLPDWYFANLCLPDDKPKIEVKNAKTEFGDCVHFLLKNITIYGNEIVTVADVLTNQFKLSDEEKTEALKTALSVFKQFPNLFDEKSQEEVTLFYEGNEYRIDKIAQINDEIWIIDFKTGTPQNPIPQQYVDQLKLYQLIYKNIRHVNARIAILWTKNLELIEIL